MGLSSLPKGILGVSVDALGDQSCPVLVMNILSPAFKLLNGVEPFAVIVTFGGIPFKGSGRDTLISICLKLSDTFLIGLVVIIF